MFNRVLLKNFQFSTFLEAALTLKISINKSMGKNYFIQL